MCHIFSFYSLLLMSTKKERREKMKRLCNVLVGIFIICLVYTPMVIQAAYNQLGSIVDGSILTEKTEVSGDTHSGARGTYLSYGSATLSNQGNHTLNVSGYTSCYKTCDQVKVTLHLQKLVSGTWTTVKTLDTKTAYNTSYVSNSQNVTVTGGYYYRISGTHAAVKGKTTESTYSSTDGMWVSK